MIPHDLHLHTNLSLCAKRDVTVADYARIAKDYGIPVIAITDHMWDAAIPGGFTDFYKKQPYEHILASKPEIEAIKDGPRILFGCETDVDMHGVVGISREVASQLDILLVPNSHTHMHGFTIPDETAADVVKHGAFMVKKFMQILESPVAEYITAIPHPFAAVACPKKDEVFNSISDKDLIDCFVAARQAGIAMEINTSGYGKKEKQDFKTWAFLRLFVLAREAGCTFTIGSDAHSPEGMMPVPRAGWLMEAAGVTEDMLLKV